jgi:hypothetical protein
MLADNKLRGDCHGSIVIPHSSISMGFLYFGYPYESISLAEFREVSRTMKLRVLSPLSVFV